MRVTDSLFSFALAKHPKFCILFAIEWLSLLCLAILSHFFVPGMIQTLINQSLVIGPKSDLLLLWEEPPIQPIMSIYMFNYTNVDQWLNGTEALKVEELGPYIYQEKWSKRNITFHDDGTVSYDLFKEYYFLPDQNDRNPAEDILKIPNIPLFSAGSSMKDAGYFTLMGFKASINAMLGNEGTSLFIEKSVKEIIWGYDDKLTAMGRSFMPAGALKSDQFGLLVGKNYSVDGRMRVHTGASDLTMVGQIKSFNEQETYNVWPDKRCDQMRGADGSFMEPMLGMKSRLEITVIDLCRTIKLVPKQYVFIGPMKTLQFLPDENLFNYDSEENKCYCPEAQAQVDYEDEESDFEEDNSFDSWFDEEEEESEETPDNLDKSKKDTCTGNGVFYIGPCKFGAPLAVSWPHFLHAEPKIETVEGLNPDPHKHQMYMNVQPEMGIGFSAYVRMQFNLKMEKSQAFPILNTLPIGEEKPFLVPIMWFEDVIEKPPENLATLLKDAIDTGPRLGETSVIILSMNLIVQLFVFLSYMLWSFHKDAE